MSLLKNYGSLDCERGGCDDEARRASISVVICKRGATKSARPPRHKMNCCSFSTDSWLSQQFDSVRVCRAGGDMFQQCIRPDAIFCQIDPARYPKTRKHFPGFLINRCEPAPMRT